MSILQNINSREDLLRLTDCQLEQLCAEIRQFLIEHVAQTGGHLASNLGVVELTVALQKVFDTRCDRLVFDVGHQSYVHKILTGRRDEFSTLRCFGGLAGFPKPSESGDDAFIAGHASNSVSVGLGMARARTLQKKNYHVISLIGDGAMTGGLAYEGLNDAGAANEDMLVILNDNGMSISENVGGISTHLQLIRSKPRYLGLKIAYRKFTKTIPGGRFLYQFTHAIKEFFKRRLIDTTFFEEIGFHYLGPIDGHDVKRLTELLESTKELHGPILLHVITQKGRGYTPAEEKPDFYHGIGPFDPETGTPFAPDVPTFSSTFGYCLTNLAKEDRRICAVTAAMQPGTGLDIFAQLFPERCFDVGIAEAHGVCMAAGLAKQGMVPIVAIYSTFLQRAYDMLLHDIGLLGLHVVFAIDRAGLVGNDGETHHGVFDVAYLQQIPGMTILAPSNQKELEQMLKTAIYDIQGPVAIRYPRGGDGAFHDVAQDPVLRTGEDLTLVTYGTMINTALEAAALLAPQGISVEVLKLSQSAPLGLDGVRTSVEKTHRILVLEEVMDAGCIADALISKLKLSGLSFCAYKKNLGGQFVQHGYVSALLQSLGLDSDSISSYIAEVLHLEESRSSGRSPSQPKPV